MLLLLLCQTVIIHRPLISPRNHNMTQFTAAHFSEEEGAEEELSSSKGIKLRGEERKVGRRSVTVVDELVPKSQFNEDDHCKYIS